MNIKGSVGEGSVGEEWKGVVLFYQRKVYWILIPVAQQTPKLTMRRFSVASRVIWSLEHDLRSVTEMPFSTR